MYNFKAKAVRLAAVFGCALTLGLGVLEAAAPAQARALTPSGATTRPASAAAYAHLAGSLTAVPVAGSTNTFFIINAQGNCLGIQGGIKTPGTDAVLWNCYTNPTHADQQWHVKTIIAGTWEQFQNSDGLCLGVAGGSNAEGANVVGWTCLGSDHPDQYWGYINNPCTGFYPLQNMKSKWVMGTKGGSAAQGTDIVQWNYQQDACNNQYWLT